MAGIPNGLRVGRTNSRTHALVAAEAESRARAANSALHLQLNPLLVDREENPVEIVESLAILQRTVIARGRLEIHLRPDAEALLKDHIAAQSEKKPTQRGVGQASGTEDTGRTGAEIIRGVEVAFNAASVRPGPGGPKAEVHIEGALRAGNRNTCKHKRQHHEGITNQFHVRSLHFLSRGTV